MTPGPRRAAFIDRDGTLIEERSYPCTEADIVPLPGAGHALRRLASAGYLIIVLTNQSAVARGMLDEERLGELHEHLRRGLSAEGGAIDDLFYCPHHPDGSHVAYAHACTCRKPGRGLLDQALAVHDIDLAGSVFIGDSRRDLFLDAGPVAARILVRSGHALDDTSGADFVADTIVEAADWLMDGRQLTPPAAAASGAADPLSGADGDAASTATEAAPDGADAPDDTLAG